MDINFGTISYNAPLTNGTVLATLTGTGAISSNGTSLRFYCKNDVINSFTRVSGQWVGDSGPVVGYYKLAPGLYLRLTFVQRNRRYVFANIDMFSSNTARSIAQMAELVYLSNDGVPPRLPNGLPTQEVAYFAEPNCISNPASYDYNGYATSCLNVRIRVAIGQLMPKYNCTASLPSTVDLGIVRGDKLAGQELVTGSFSASLNCGIAPVVSIRFDGPPGSVGYLFNNIGSAGPLALSLKYAGSRIFHGQSFSPPASGVNNNYIFDTSLISSSNTISTGTVNVPVSWVITYD